MNHQISETTISSPDSPAETGIEPTASKSRGGLVDTLTLLITISALTVSTLGWAAVADPDLWWHLGAGRWMLAHGSVPGREVFGAPILGRAWIDYSWLFDLLITPLFNTWGLRAMMGLTVVLALAYTIWVTAFLSRFTNLRRALILTAAANLALMPLKSSRPWLFTILFFAMILTFLWLAREKNRPAWLLPVIPIVAIWANLHIQFVYGLALIGLFALELSLPPALRQLLSAEAPAALRSSRVWLLLLASTLAALLNPYNWKVYLVAALFAMDKLGPTYVSEMQAMPFRSFPNWTTLVLVCAAFFMLGKARRKNLLLISLLIVSCVFAFRAQRDVWFPVTVAILVLAVGSERYTATDAVLPISRYRRAWLIAAPVSCVATLVVLLLRPEFSPAELDKAVARTFPVKAVDYIEQNRLPGPLFNTFNWGGYLIWRVPRLLVSVDGRVNMYQSTLEGSLKAAKGYKNWAQDPGFRKAGTILVDADNGLATVLRLDPQFRLVYEDDLAAVFQPVTRP